MMSVDNELLTKHEHIALSAEISSGYYDVVDNKCTLAPFVDKLIWKIDETSLCAFPNNVGWYNDFDSWQNMAAQKTHIMHMFIARFCLSGRQRNLYDIAIVTDDMRYIEYEVVQKH